MSESFVNFLLEKRRENKGEMETGLKTKYTGDWGELFIANYLYELFEANNIKNDIDPHNFSQDDYDLEISINGRRYKFEVKFSRSKTGPVFNQIHFNNDFDYLLLIYHPSYDKIYFAILTKDEARDIATPENTNREYEDNWQIQTSEIFDDDNTNFLKRLSEFLELNKELEDLEDNEKIYLIENAKEEVIKEHPNAIRKDFSGITYQQWICEYLSNYTDEVEPKPNGDDYDIEFKGKSIEIKYSALHDNGDFRFAGIKPDNFEYILFIGFDNEKNKFYFEIKNKDEMKNWFEEHDNNFQENGNYIHVGKSFFRFGNDLTFEDFNNYIESH